MCIFMLFIIIWQSNNRLDSFIAPTHLISKNVKFLIEQYGMNILDKYFEGPRTNLTSVSIWHKNIIKSFNS
jgi:hypothetical protein